MQRLFALLGLILLAFPLVSGVGMYHCFMDWIPEKQQVVLHDPKCQKSGSDICTCPLPLRPNVKDKAFVDSCKNFTQSKEFFEFEKGYFREQNKPLRSCRRSCSVDCFCNRCWYLNMCCWAYVVNPTRYTHNLMFDCLFGRNILPVRNGPILWIRYIKRSTSCPVATLQPSECEKRCGSDKDPQLGEEAKARKDCRDCMDSCCKKRPTFHSLKDTLCCLAC